MRQFRNVDLSAYARSFVLLARFPQVMVGPLLAGIFVFFLLPFFQPNDSGALGQLSGLLNQILSFLATSFGLAFSLIVADLAWRRDRVSLADAWTDAQRKLGGIFFAAIGVSFATSVAGIVGSFLGPIFAIVLMLVAVYFLIYAMPAAAIGGVPGSGSLQISIDRAKDNPAPTILVVAVSLVIQRVAPTLITALLTPFLSSIAAPIAPIADTIVQVLVEAVLNGYLAFVLAKTYAELSYGRRW